MQTNAPIINDANLVNSINSRAYSLSNQGLVIDRSIMISNYTQETIDACWTALSTNILQNYQKGKGTYIKYFGTFTFKPESINLEGTTNQYVRDKKPKNPVFIVSKEYIRDFAAGEYTRQNGIRYYTQKESKDISIVKLNFAQIAYSISLSKDETMNLINNLILYLMESMTQKTFKNKLMPGVGVLLTRGNIVAVKFDNNLIEENKYKNYKNTFTKKNILMDMNMSSAQDAIAKDCISPYDNIEDLKAKNSLITKVENDAKNVLKKSYDTDIMNFPQHEVKNIYKTIEKNMDCTFNFLNDNKTVTNNFYKLKKNISNIRLKKIRHEENNLPLSYLDEDIIKDFEYCKGLMIKNCKSFDFSRSGIITKEEAIKALLMSNFNPKLDNNLAKNILDSYNKTDNVEYMKFIAQLVKDSKLTLIKINSKNYTNVNSSSIKLKKYAFSQDKKIKLKKTSSQIIEEEKRPKKILETNVLNKKPLSQSQSFTKIDFKNISTNNLLFNRQKETESNKKKLTNIINLIPELKRKYFISLDQKLSSEEFLNILKNNSISYPKETMDEILTFIGIPDISAFSLREFDQQIKQCKILTTNLEISELNEIMKKLKDIVYINGGKNFFFSEEKKSIDCDTFVNLFKSKNAPYENDVLINVFYFLVKTDRNFNENDYMNYFENPGDKINFNEPHFLVMMQKLQNIISQRNLKPEEYYDFLISKNKSTKDKFISRLNWINYLQGENMKCSAEELDNFFSWVDTKNDGVIDRFEFLGRFEYRNKPLTTIKNIILENKLDIEDLAHRMGMGVGDLTKLDFENFQKKIKMLDYTYPEKFILELFEELTKQKIKDEKNKKYITSKEILDEINYIKPLENYNSFIKNYSTIVRNKITHEELKSQFEKFDTDFLGTLTKLEFVKAVTPLFPEFTDQDHLLFLRVTNMLDKDGNVTYTKLLNYIYYFCNDKLNDPFTKMCEILSNYLVKECDEDIEKLMYLIDTGIAQKKTSLIVHQPLSINQIKTFLEKKEKNIIFPEKIIQKLDIDADGLISFEDLRAVLKRFIHTSFFKFSNDSNDPNINLFSKEKMSEYRFKGIIQKLNDYIKKKNINQVGLFRKFDKDNDGFISNIDFNSVIGEIIPLAPAMKDQFFNYLDFYHNGMVDLNTFIVALEGFSNSNVLIQNNNKIENEILDEFKKFIIKNNKLSDNEIFQVLDKDCDGLVNIDDFRKFVVMNLNIPEKEFTNSKLQRVMMSISLSKNFQIGLNDIREMINLCNQNREHMNLKEVFKLTTNQNLSDQKKNKEWTNDIIERLGMFVSEKYDSIEQFFEENIEKGENKFKFTDLIKFHEKNFELFNNGFNLTNDELLSLFTSLDSHKKNYLTLQDLKNKLQVYNFYNKMHIDVKNFMQENFINGIDAFKFFAKKDITFNQEDKSKYCITLKEFFDTFEIFFPKKYSTNTILKYVNKYFNIVTSANNIKSNLTNKKDTISFSEFNYIYFDSVKDDNYFLKKKILDTKLMTNRQEISKKIKNDLIHNPQNNFYYSNLFKKNYKELLTPFDKDPLNKIKRILCSSKYNINRFFEQLEKECGPNNYVVNKYQFRNIIKTLDLGLSNLEIDQIMHKCGKVTYDGNLNLKEFVTYLYSVNQILEEGKNNIVPIISEIKGLIYKYYSSPIICFQNNDINHVGKIDFENFKNIIFDMYSKNEQPLPNFTLIKNAFDTIDLRKDGMIDINEWCKVLGTFNGKLDFGEEKVPNGFDFYDNNKFLKLKTLKKGSNFSLVNNRRVLREWETSTDVSDIYKYINKNKKMIKQKIKDSNYSIGTGSTRLIQPDNLVLILKGVIPNNRLSLTQWKMIVNVAKKDTLDGLIDLNEFFRLMEVTTKKMTSHPSIINKKRMVKSTSDLNVYNMAGMSGPMFKTLVGGFKNDNQKNILRKMQKDLYDIRKINENKNNIRDNTFNRTARMKAIS